MYFTKQLLESIKKEPIRFEKYYVGTADTTLLRNNKKYHNVKSVNICLNSDISNSRLALNVYRKNEKGEYYFIKTYYFLVEPYDFNNSEKSKILNSNVILNGILKNNVLKKNEINNFITNIVGRLKELNVPTSEIAVWKDMLTYPLKKKRN